MDNNILSIKTPSIPYETYIVTPDLKNLIVYRKGILFHYLISPSGLLLRVHISQPYNNPTLVIFNNSVQVIDSDTIQSVFNFAGKFDIRPPLKIDNSSPTPLKSFKFISKENRAYIVSNSKLLKLKLDLKLGVKVSPASTETSVLCAAYRETKVIFYWKEYAKTSQEIPGAEEGTQLHFTEKGNYFWTENNNLHGNFSGKILTKNLGLKITPENFKFSGQHFIFWENNELKIGRLGREIFSEGAELLKETENTIKKAKPIQIEAPPVQKHVNIEPKIVESPKNSAENLAQQKLVSAEISKITEKLAPIEKVERNRPISETFLDKFELDLQNSPNFFKKLPSNQNISQKNVEDNSSEFIIDPKIPSQSSYKIIEKAPQKVAEATIFPKKFDTETFLFLRKKNVKLSEIANFYGENAIFELIQDLIEENEFLCESTERISDLFKAISKLE